MKSPAKLNYRSRGMVVFLALVAVSAANVWAAPVFKFDPVLLSEQRYDDNIFLTRSNTRSDWITTVGPGFTSSVSHPRLNAELEYQAGFVYFLHNPEFDYTRHEVNFNGSMRLTRRLTFSLSESYRRAADTQLEEFVGTAEERSLRRQGLDIFNRNTVAPELEYRFGEGNLARLYYRNTGFRDEDPTGDDYRENYFEGEMEYWFNVRNGVNLMSRYTKGNFERETDILNSIGGTARYMHRLTPHFEMHGEYGIARADFEETRFFRLLDRDGEAILESEDLTPVEEEFLRRSEEGELVELLTIREDLEDYDVHAVSLGFEWQLERDLRVEGSIGYFWRQGVGSNDEEGITSLLEIEKATRHSTVTVAWESGYSENFFAVRDSGFVKFWRVSTDLRYTYQEKLEFTVRGSYGFQEYTLGRTEVGLLLQDREDYRYSARAQLRYHIVRNYGFLSELTLNVQFDHVELDSDIDAEYYINDRVTAKLTATF